jgi:hypothetical protein
MRVNRHIPQKKNLSLRSKAIITVSLGYLTLVAVFVYSSFVSEQQVIEHEMSNTCLSCTRTVAGLVHNAVARRDVGMLDKYTQRQLKLRFFSATAPWHARSSDLAKSAVSGHAQYILIR